MSRIILFLFIIISSFTFAQKQANIWYFGYHAGVDFNPVPPVALINGALNQLEGVSSIADSNGRLLFYTDGRTVYDSTHNVMPNGTGLLGNWSATQSALIIQKPGSINLYYIFTVDQYLSNGGFNYSIVDMNLNSGLGDVVTKNILLSSSFTEKLTACTKSNGRDVWIITHDSNNNNFQSYSLTSGGINPFPVISSIGPNISWTLDVQGYMKVSPSGTRLAMVLEGSNQFWLFDFDNSSGLVSNPIQLNSTGALSYSVEFSPNSKVLYGSVGLGARLFQWDLSLSGAAAINASRIPLNPALLGSIYIGALALGPDKKIYFTREHGDYLGAINNPDVVGTGCNIIDTAIYLQGKQCDLGLPNLNQSFFNNVYSFTPACFGDTTYFQIPDTSGLLSVVWDFGDAASGLNNTSVLFNPSHRFTNAGNFNVRLIRNFTGFTDTCTFLVTIVPCNFPIVNFMSTDSSFCNHECIDFSDQSLNNPVNWYWSFPGGNPDTSNLQNPNQICYNQPGYYDVTLTACNGSGCDTLQMHQYITVYPDVQFSPLSQNGDTLFLTQGLSGYQWYDGTQIISGASDYYYIADHSGSYSVLVTDSNGCTAFSTLLNVIASSEYILSAGDFRFYYESGVVTLEIYSTGSSQAVVQLTDAMGRLISIQNISIINGGNKITLQADSPKSGLYFMQIYGKNYFVSKKLLIE